MKKTDGGPLEAGQRVRVLNQNMGGTVIVEGIATLVRPQFPDRKTTIGDPELWVVQFDGDDETAVSRWIDRKDRRR